MCEFHPSGMKLLFPLLLGCAVTAFAAEPVNVNDFPEEKLDFPIAPGPFAPTWDSINQNYGAWPAWFNQSKFGIWIHFGPQAAGRSGDWYAAKLYMPTNAAYPNHLKNYGHPSEVGYKDVLNQWRLPKWKPEKWMKAFRDAGARYVLIMGVHHDNFDLWDSKYQPWNSVNIGPKRDMLGEWKRAALKNDMRFGVSFHHEYTWWWYQPAFGADATGPRAGVPYDGNLTKADGNGRWWDGYDPAQLYTIRLAGYPEYEPLHGIAHGREGIFHKHLDYARSYATQWAQRIQDVIEKYDPDFIYTDGNSTQPFSGKRSGSGYKSDAGARVVAHYYNRTLAQHGKVDTFSVIKFHQGTRGVARTYEGGFARDFNTNQLWFGENAVGDWFYRPGFVYDPGMVIRALLEYMARGGNYTVCISLTPDGDLDAGNQRLLREVGAWLRINGEGIYDSTGWRIIGEGATVVDANRTNQPPRLKTPPGGGGMGQAHADFTFSEQDFRFTVGKDGSHYAWCMTLPKPGATLRIKSLGTDAKLLDGPIKSVTLLGSKAKLDWNQTADGLVIQYPKSSKLKMAVGFKISL